MSVNDRMKIARVQRGEPKKAKEFLPLCAACRELVQPGEWMVPVPVGPGTSEENRDLLRRGFEFESVTVFCHHACVTGYDEPGPSRLEKTLQAAALRSEVETYVAFQKMSPEDQAREIAVAAQGLRDPSFNKERYIAWRRANIATGIKGLGETFDAEALVAEYGGTW